MKEKIKELLDAIKVYKEDEAFNMLIMLYNKNTDISILRDYMNGEIDVDRKDIEACYNRVNDLIQYYLATY